jgi:hypothetical protein
MPDIDIETITPEIAQKYLAMMPHNRRLRESRVKEIFEDMKGDQYRQEAGDPIRFAASGVFFDGQHRMQALVRTGHTYQFIVLRNIPDDVMSALDQGRPRNVSDVLYMVGEEETGALSGLLNYIHQYTISGEFGAIWGAPRIKGPAALDAMEANGKRLRHATVATKKVARVLPGGHSKWAAVYYILSGIDAEDANVFVDQLYTGLELEASSPIYHLRNKLLDHKAVEFSIRDWFAITIKGWNAWRKGDRVNGLRWRPGGRHAEKFPVPL